MYSLLIWVFLVLSAFDYKFTLRRLQKYGADVELNPVINWGARVFGLQKGLILGTLVPAALMAAMFFAYPIWGTLCFAVGYRVSVAIFQLASIKYEADLAKILKDLEAKHKEDL